MTLTHKTGKTLAPLLAAAGLLVGCATVKPIQTGTTALTEETQDLTNMRTYAGNIEKKNPMRAEWAKTIGAESSSAELDSAYADSIFAASGVYLQKLEDSLATIKNVLDANNPLPLVQRKNEGLIYR